MPSPADTPSPPSSLDAPPGMAAVVAGITATVVSFALAVCQVILERGFEAGDLIPFAFWSVLFGVGTAGVARALLLVVTPGLGLGFRHLLGTIAGALAALGFLAFVAAVLGPWMGAFGFPILLYWAIGGAAGQCLAVRMTEDLS